MTGKFTTNSFDCDFLCQQILRKMHDPTNKDSLLSYMRRGDCHLIFVKYYLYSAVIIRHRFFLCVFFFYISRELFQLLKPCSFAGHNTRMGILWLMPHVIPAILTRKQNHPIHPPLPGHLECKTPAHFPHSSRPSWGVGL